MGMANAAIARFRATCAAAGFDLIQPFSTSWCSNDPQTQLPSCGRPGALAALVGNTRALWPLFLDDLRRHPERLERENAIDAYAEERITAAATAAAIPFEIRWAHDMRAPILAIQRLAHLVGMAWLSPANICIHPRFGPWIGLRAAVVFDLDASASSAPDLSDPCGACTRTCLPAFAVAQCDTRLASNWRAWLAVRDACPLGRAHRYDDDQILYHYTKDRDILRRAVAAAGITAGT